MTNIKNKEERERKERLEKEKVFKEEYRKMWVEIEDRVHKLIEERFGVKLVRNNFYQVVLYEDSDDSSARIYGFEETGFAFGGKINFFVQERSRDKNVFEVGVGDIKSINPIKV